MIVLFYCAALGLTARGSNFFCGVATCSTIIYENQYIAYFCADALHNR